MYESFKEIILIKDSLKRNLHINTKKSTLASYKRRMGSINIKGTLWQEFLGISMDMGQAFSLGHNRKAFLSKILLQNVEK